MSELGAKVDAADQEIVVQQRKLTNTSELVKALFSKGETELFIPAAGDNSKFCMISLPQKGANVYMLLKSVPIYQTIQLQFHIYVQPKYSYTMFGNVLFFRWGDAVESIKQYPLSVSYVPDPTYQGRSYSSLNVRDGHAFADTLQLP